MDTLNMKSNFFFW